MTKTLKTFWLEIILALLPVLIFLVVLLDHANFDGLPEIVPLIFSIFTFVLIKKTTRSLGMFVACGWMLCYFGILPGILWENLSIPEYTWREFGVWGRYVITVLPIAMLWKYSNQQLSKNSRSKTLVSIIELIKFVATILVALFSFWLFNTECYESCSVRLGIYSWFIVIISIVLVLPYLFLCFRQVRAIFNKSQRQKGDVVYAMLLVLSLFLNMIVIQFLGLTCMGQI